VYVHQYLLFEQARFGNRLRVVYKVEPEVLSTVVPTLILQPIVENAVKHGIETGSGRGRITIEAQDQDDECWLMIHDDGAGFEVNGVVDEQGTALANIHQRLRQTYGLAHGLVIKSKVGSGTTVQMRIPKYRPGVRAS
jgi:two-component system LytT family sensor kinase